MTDPRAMAIAYVERQLAAYRAADEQAARAVEAAMSAPAATPSGRRGNGSSVVFSVRLDPDELAALETRAANAGIRPSVLARNLIRAGLAPRPDELASAVTKTEAALSELSRALQGVPAR